MAIDTTLFTDFTWAQIKLGVKHSLMSSFAGGVNLTIAGRSIGRVPVERAKEIYVWADTMEALDGDANGGIILGGFGEPQ